MFYHAVDAFGDTTEVFETRDEALGAFESGAVKNVFNTYRPGYHRELTKPESVRVDGQWVGRRPTRAECIANDVAL